MANNLKLKVVGLPCSIIEKFANQSITTVQDFLSSNIVELQRKTGLTYQKLVSISEIINSFIAPPGIPASKLNQSTCITFNDELDYILQGGIKCGHITEFSGAPGLGKSQLCFQLSLSNTVNGQVNGVLYIDSEGSFSAARLSEIAFYKYGLKTPEKLQHHLNRIHLWHPGSFSDVMDKIKTIEVFIIKERIGLLIIDSSSLVRRDFGSEKSIERASLMCSLSSRLKIIAECFNLAVIVTNHVTSKFEINEYKNEATTVPALGPSWSHWINSRLHLTVNNNIRCLCISKSPEIPEITINYAITKRGFEMFQSSPLE